MKTHVVKNDSIEIEQAPWGSLQWLVSGQAGTSEHMTFGVVKFKPGEGNPGHYHPNCEEILYVISGELEHRLPEGGSAKLVAGDCIVLPEGGKHHAVNVGDSEAVVVVVFNNAERKAIGE